MGLSITDRGMVDKIIDEAVKAIPGWMETYRDEVNRKFYHIDNIEDFVFGICYGYILSAFSHLYSLEHKEDAPPEHIKEFVSVFNNRMKEIKEAIFKTG